MTAPVIELQQLSCERDERCLFQHLDLKVYAGDVLQVEGPNGSGKTTLLRVLTTISADYEGNILWKGQPFKRERMDYLSQLIYIGHLPSIKKALSPRQNLHWYTALNVNPTSMTIDQALEAVGLFGFEDVPSYTLSAGQQRRVALARLYLTSAPVWILDEPFTAIDKHGVARLENQIAEHAAAGGTVILTTHQTLNIDNVRNINLIDFRQSESADCIDGRLSNDQAGEAHGTSSNNSEYQSERQQ